MNPFARTTLLFSLLLFGISASLFAQHPIGYSSLKGVSKTGNVVFEAMNREILKEKAASFFVDAPCSMSFDILVAANGKVKYVRSGRCQTDQHQMRLACTSALYGYEFSALPEADGEKWFKAVISVSEE